MIKKDYRNFYKINLLSGTCGSTDIDVEFILGPPTPEGRVTVGDTHFTEQDLTRPVELRILHTEKEVFFFFLVWSCLVFILFNTFDLHYSYFNLKLIQFCYSYCYNHCLVHIRGCWNSFLFQILSGRLHQHQPHP